MSDPQAQLPASQNSVMQAAQPQLEGTPSSSTPSASATQPTPPRVVTTHQVGRYEVRVIREKCIGAASCVAIAPNTFDLDEENIAIILDQHGDDDETRLLAAQSCPTAAIEVIDTETGEMVWPR